MNFIAPKYWTKDELVELQRAFRESNGGALPVFYDGHWGVFTKVPTINLLSESVATVDMEFRRVGFPS